jgi:hypothetical protein
MEKKSKRVAIVVKDPGRFAEGLRSTLGLLLDNHYSSIFMMDQKIEATSKLEEDIEFLKDMEGEAYTNVADNAEALDLELLSWEESVAKIKENEIIIAF